MRGIRPDREFRIGAGLLDGGRIDLDAGSRDELARIGDRFQIHQNHARMCVTRQQVQPVCRIDVGYVTQRHHTRKANVVFSSPVDQRSRNRARLRQQCDVAHFRRHVRKTCIEVEGRDHQADRIRPDDAQEVRPRRIEHRLAQAIFPRYAGSDHHGGPATLHPQIGDNLRNRIGRCRDDGEIGHAWKGPGIGITWMAAHRGMLGVDKPDIAPEASLKHVFRHDTANSLPPVGRPENSSRPRTKRVFQVSYRHAQPLPGWPTLSANAIRCVGMRCSARARSTT